MSNRKSLSVLRVRTVSNICLWHLDIICERRAHQNKHDNSEEGLLSSWNELLNLIKTNHLSLSVFNILALGELFRNYKTIHIIIRYEKI